MKLATILLVLEDYMLPCFTKKIFGFDCPGCGMQRALSFLLQGNFEDAFYMYPAIYPIIALFGFIILKQFITIRRENTITYLLLLVTVVFIMTNFIWKFI